MTQPFSFPPPPPPPPQQTASIDNWSRPPYPRGQIEGNGHGSHHLDGGRLYSNRGNRGRVQYNRQPRSDYLAQHKSFRIHNLGDQVSPSWGGGRQRTAQENLKDTYPACTGYVRSTNSELTNDHLSRSHDRRPHEDHANEYLSHKRKRDQVYSYTSKDSHYSHSRVKLIGSHEKNRSKLQVAPAVPSFGFIPPAVASGSISKAPSAKNSRADHIKSGLGLAAHGDADDESGNEDIDEEAAYAGVGVELRIEYDGEIFTLRSPGEIKAWINERRKQFPTQRRIEEKRQERISQQEVARRLRKEIQHARGCLVDKGTEKPKAGLIQSDTNFSDNSKGRSITVGVSPKCAHREPCDLVLVSKSTCQKEVLSDSQNTQRPIRATTNEESINSFQQVSPQSTTTDSIPSSALQDRSSLSHCLGLDYGSDCTEDLSDAVSQNSDASSEVSSSSSDAEGSKSGWSVDGDDEAPTEESSKSKSAVEVAQVYLSSKSVSTKGLVHCSQDGQIVSTRVRGEEHSKHGPRKRVRLLDKLVERELEDRDRKALQAIKQLGSLGLFTQGSNSNDSWG